MVVHWSEKLEDRFSTAFAIPGFLDATGGFNFDIIFRDSAFCRLAVELLCREVKARSSKKRVDFIAFLEKQGIGLLTLAGAVTIYTGIPNLIIGERIKFVPEAGEFPLKDAEVVLLTEYIITGAEFQPAVKAIQELGGKVVKVIVLVWDAERFNKNGEMNEVGITEEMRSLLYPASEVERIAKESKKVLQPFLSRLVTE